MALDWTYSGWRSGRNGRYGRIRRRSASRRARTNPVRVFDAIIIFAVAFGEAIPLLLAIVRKSLAVFHTSDEIPAALLWGHAPRFDRIRPKHGDKRSREKHSDAANPNIGVT